MKKQKSESKGLVKGAPSGFIISLAVHLGAFLLAGLLVVFTVVQQEEKVFAPPQPVERPKMKLKKPKVKVKKTARPKSPARIVTKIQKADMPDIQLPEMAGVGEGLIGGSGAGFDMMPELGGELSPYGNSFTTGSDLEGQFIDFKRDRRGRGVPMAPDQMEDLIHKFMKHGWKKTIISQYYHSPTKLYTTTICIPTTLSEVAPWAFGEEDTIGYCWAVLYEGMLVYPEDITFRFWGVGDKFMAVQVDGETVLFCAYRERTRQYFSDIWDTADPKDYNYYFAEARARPGDWITLKANEAKKMKVILGDLDGGLNYHILSVEVKGQEYPYTRTGGGPTFPVFRTAEIPRDVQDAIYKNLYKGDACITNGPIFRDFVRKETPPPKPPEDPEPPVLKKRKMEKRVWTSITGETLEATFRTMMGETAVLEADHGRQIKFPFDQLIPEDQELIQLINPPEFRLNLRKSRKKLPYPEISPYSGGRPLKFYDFTFGVGATQTSADRGYDFEIKVEYFVVGHELVGDQYQLLDHRTASFNPADYKGETFEFRGDSVRVRQIAYRDTNHMRGTEYFGYLIVLTDKAGDIISYEASHDFLFRNLFKLRELKPGNFFNDRFDRDYPTQPTEDNRGYGAIDGSG